MTRTQSLVVSPSMCQFSDELFSFSPIRFTFSCSVLVAVVVALSNACVALLCHREWKYCHWINRAAKCYNFSTGAHKELIRAPSFIDFFAPFQPIDFWLTFTHQCTKTRPLFYRAASAVAAVDAQVSWHFIGTHELCTQHWIRMNTKIAQCITAI